uniref:Cilia- and flagella-associated protein 418 n=1 Tax=Tetradesmus obliquus TaxID=3088 RepID=A0A383V7U9_TETOB|eukprot:jgi/Sobl393_1/19205/SZX60664.1
MAVAKHPQLVDDLLQELADLPTVSRRVACHTTATTNISSSHAAKAALQAAAQKSGVSQLHQQKQQQQQRHRQCQPDDLECLLNQLREDSTLLQQEQASQGNNTAACTGRPAVTSLSGGTSARLKCSSIYLGGSKDGRGCCRPMQPAPCCCDRLKCLSCDFQVLWHADARWAADVDYMFFRNSYGVAAQTSLKLQPCRGSAAMCCQCSWASCSRPTKLADAAEQAGHQLRWICRGHDSQA